MSRSSSLRVGVLVACGTPGCTSASALLPTADPWIEAGGASQEAGESDTDPSGGDPSTPDTASRDTASDTGGPPTYTFAWEDPAWWREAGPLQGLFDLSLSVDQPHWRFWYITSPDLVTWSEPVVLGHNFSSMDLLHLDSGLVLSGSLIPNVEVGIEGPFSAIFSLVTTDLETWGTHFISVEGADELPMIIDPSIHPDGEGYRALFFGAGSDVDPEALPDDYPNPHSIRTGWMRGDRVVVDDLTPIVQGDHIVDPTGCWWQGVHHVLATNKYGDLFHQYRPEGGVDFVDGVDWGGVQVPYCFIDPAGERMGLMAQHGGGHGPPRVRWCDVDQVCGEQEPLVSEDHLFEGQCTSPVMAYFEGRYVLFCSSWYEGPFDE